MIRVIRRHPDPFVQITTGAILCWIIGQALVNIAVVIGLAPVIGVPLPLVSAGGSALIMTMAALGVLISFARSEPGAARGARRPARRGPALARRRSGGPVAERTDPCRRRCCWPAAAPRATSTRCSRWPTSSLRRHPNARLTVLGTAEGLESGWSRSTASRWRVVPRVPLPRRPTLDWFRLPGRLRDAVRAAGAAIDDSGAQVVVGFGGYVATPAYLAARRRGIPVVIHEQNARPGLANRLGARWARSVAVTFPGTALRGAQVTGLPLRAPIARAGRSSASTTARARAPPPPPSSVSTPTLPDAPGVRRVARRRERQHARSRAPRRTCSRRASRCCT